MNELNDDDGFDKMDEDLFFGGLDAPLDFPYLKTMLFTSILVMMIILVSLHFVEKEIQERLESISSTPSSSVSIENDQ